MWADDQVQARGTLERQQYFQLSRISKSQQRTQFLFRFGEPDGRWLNRRLSSPTWNSCFFRSPNQKISTCGFFAFSHTQTDFNCNSSLLASLYPNRFSNLHTISPPAPNQTTSQSPHTILTPTSPPIFTLIIPQSPQGGWRAIAPLDRVPVHREW